MSWSPRVKVFVLLIVGLAMATVGMMTYVTFPIIMKSEMKKRLVLKEGSETFNFWKSIPVPIYIRFYFFNIKNPMEFWANTSKPIVEELGPYTFREEREKVNITWNVNGTVSYRQLKRWYYETDLTNGSLEDIVTTLNVPMIAAAAKAKSMNDDFTYFAISQMFDYANSTWFIQKSVKELLFEGYEDPLITAAKIFSGLPFDKFGWFYGRNNSDDGEFNIFTGELDLNTYGEVDEWNGESIVNDWEPPCNMINGSAGDLFPPGKTASDKVSMFVTDICRTLPFTYSKESHVKGLRAYRYWADNTVLDNGEINPDNWCYCLDVCLPAGGLDVSTCKFEAPAVVSYPHFFLADPSYAEGVIGLHPDPKKHEMYLDIEPQMGVPVEVAARMQINIVFEGVPKLPDFANVTGRTYFPIIWFSETAEMTDSLAKQLKFVLTDLPLIADIVAYVLTTFGSILVLSALILAVFYFHQKKHQEYSTVDLKKT